MTASAKKFRPTKFKKKTMCTRTSKWYIVATYRCEYTNSITEIQLSGICTASDISCAYAQKLANQCGASSAIVAQSAAIASMSAECVPPPSSCRIMLLP